MHKNLINILTLVPAIKRQYEEKITAIQRYEDLVAHDRLIEAEMERLQDQNKSIYFGNSRLEEEKNLLEFELEELDKLHDEITLRNWRQDTSLKQFTCLHPFCNIEILPQGEVYTCCSTSLKYGHYLGKLYEASQWEDIWNSDKAKKLRYSVSEGSFEYCNHFCKWLTNLNPYDEKSPLNLRENSEYHYSRYEECVANQMPQYITLSCDVTCNLKCPSCRSVAKGMTAQQSELLLDKLQQLIYPMLSSCKVLTALASGEFFASVALQNFFQLLSHEQFPEMSIFFITNLQLFTPQKWDELKNLHDMKIQFAVSVDATQKATYEKVRRGGVWETLLENLEFLSSLKHQGKVASIQLNFVVQEENYTQILGFIEFAKRFSADSVEFQRLANWGTYSAKEFEQIDVLNPLHIHYAEARMYIEQVQKASNGLRILVNGL